MADKSVFLTSTDDPNFVDSIALIKLAQQHGISLTEKYPKVKTVKQLVKLRDWVYAEVRKKDPKFQPEY
jgi:hypothetical protein